MHVPEKPTVLAGHLKYTDTRPFKNNTHATVINNGHAALLNVTHTVVCAVELASVLTAATILADAAVTPTVSEMTYNVSSGMLNHTQPTFISLQVQKDCC